MKKHGIVLVGLGPGNVDLVTKAAWEYLHSCDEIYVRTIHHPVATLLAERMKVHSFDYLYDQEETFELVYARIIEEILALGERPEGVAYALPGHPLIAEATSAEILRRAKELGLPVTLLPGLSFIEPLCEALEIDLLPHTAILDAFEIALAHVPPFPPSAPAIIAQIYSREMAAEIKLTLTSIYPDEHRVALVHAAGTDQQRVEHLALYEIDRSVQVGTMTSLYVPPLAKGTSFEEFQELIAHLRAPDGCPWDRKQTHQSLRTHLLEETYELLSAIDGENFTAMQEELGDVLLQVVLHAQIAWEEGEFNINSVLEQIYAKIVRRHPHVFGGMKIEDAEHVLENWERLKAEERNQHGEAKGGLLDGIPATLPALAQALEIQRRVARVGFDWEDVHSVMEKLVEELGELERASSAPHMQEEFGDVLFSLVNLGRWHHLDAESALRGANERFRQRFKYIEMAAAQRGKSLSEMPLEEMEALWQEAKALK